LVITSYIIVITLEAQSCSYLKTKSLSPRIYSLQKRAVTFSLLVSGIIVLVIFFGYINLKTAHSQASEHLSKRDSLLVMITDIRGNLLDSYKDLNNFLLAPDNKSYQKNINFNINLALKISSRINSHVWIEQYNKEKDAVRLDEELSNLKKHIEELIEARLDPNTQFPSLQVGADTMQPNRNNMNNALALAVNEMRTDNAQVTQPTAYAYLIQTRHLWTQVLSNFRLYLANRVGSFNEGALPVQEKGITTLYGQLHQELQKLQLLADKDELGFETADAVEQMLESSRLWFGGFSLVKEIHKSKEWRYDALLMKGKIAPGIDNVVNQLTALETIIKESNEEDVLLLNRLGEKQNILLVVLAIIFFVFISLIMYSINKLVFKPIAEVSDALKSEALGKKGNINMLVNSKETRALVNAFGEMSHQVHIRQEELEYRALHDSLTSLANRTLLLDRVEHQIISAKREGDSKSLSLLVIDLDRFKEVNDTLGHIAGDNLLIKVGAEIKAVLREIDTVARLGGDEFSVLLPDTGKEGAKLTSEKIQRVLTKTFEIDTIEVSVGASIGISLFPDHGDDVQSLIRYADIAMYSAKTKKTGYEVYNPDDDAYTVSRLSMINELRDAIENKKLDVHFQPVIDLKLNKIVGVEALARWHSEKFGFVTPDTFIELAEQINLINPLTYLVIEKAISTVSQWHKVNPDIDLAINLSVYSLKDSNFTTHINDALNRHGFSASCLTLEITESAMMDNPLTAIDKLTEIRSMGIKLSIDDYGTGFSSMAYLKRLPVDILKIDKSFVIDMDEDRSNDAIVRSTIKLAHNLGLKVIAEGIETKDVNKLLVGYECDLGQGYFFAKPQSAEEIKALWLS